MKNIAILVTFVHAWITSSGHVYLEEPEHNPITAVKDLILREMGFEFVKKFKYKVIPKTDNGFDVFEVSQKNKSVELAGSSGTAMASAFQWYLKQIMSTQTDWNEHNYYIHGNLKPVKHKVRIERSTKYSYYQNVCTVSYSMWSWDWEKWEKHIDWMAMNGINMALAFTGQEKVWANLFSKHYNITKNGLQRFFAGAAFLAWGRMGNIRGGWVKGPLPEHFIERQYQLQVQILARMKEFGMIPALPAFAGHVPEELKNRFPKSNFVQSPQWNKFPDINCCVYMLDPTDPLYIQIGEAYIKEQEKLYGSVSSLYQCDTYNEMNPKKSDLMYLQNSSKAVISSIKKADPQGVWLMQGWLFLNKFWSNDKIESYLKGVPDDSMIILDLYSDYIPYWSKTQNFFGKDWIFCVLHNFGGNSGISGNLPLIGKEPLFASKESNGSMVGIGLTMEGIYQNYVVYDLALEMAWRHEPIQLMKWIVKYSIRRYHMFNAEAAEAWKMLASSVYSEPDRGMPRSRLIARPYFKQSSFEEFMISSYPFSHYEKTFFKTSQLVHQHSMVEIWMHILLSYDKLQHIDTYRHDVVDISRQTLVNLFDMLYLKLRKEYDSRHLSVSKFKDKVDEILHLILDIDKILATNENFLLGKWLEDAKSLGKTIEDEKYYEYQARNQITRWGDQNHNAVGDYAYKHWAGLVKSYYYKRWETHFKELIESYKHNQEFNDAKVQAEIEKFEIGWQLDQTQFPTKVSGDTIDISIELFHKYRHKFDVQTIKSSFISIE